MISAKRKLLFLQCGRQEAQLKKMTMMALAALALAGAAEAKTLEEILKEKGVITAEEYAEATKKSTPAYYEPGKGVSVESADGRYRAQLGGYAQLRYSYADKDDAADDDSSSFSIRRFKLVLQGNVYSKNLGYKFQGDISDGFTTEDAFLNYTFAPPLIVQVGQFKPPQSRQELTSAARQLFAERSLANDTFNLGRDLGLQASGGFSDKLLEYSVGVFNGNGPNTGNPDNRHMVAARLDLNPLGPYPMDEAGWPADTPLVNLGASLAWNKVGTNDIGDGFDRDNDVMDVALGLDALTDNDRTVDGEIIPGFRSRYGSDLNWLLWTANLNAAWKGATFAAEYYRLEADPDEGSGWDADGYYVQAGYQVIPQKLELAARYSAIDSDDSDASARFDRSETQFGANYYFAKHNLKLQTDLTLVEDDLNDDEDDTIFRLQAQLYY